MAATLGTILWFLLLMSTAANTAIFTRHYPLLIGLNAILALAMVGLVTWQLRSLWRDYRAQVFGCLLYTSPSPRDRTRYRMPSSA